MFLGYHLRRDEKGNLNLDNYVNEIKNIQKKHASDQAQHDSDGTQMSQEIGIAVQFFASGPQNNHALKVETIHNPSNPTSDTLNPTNSDSDSKDAIRAVIHGSYIDNPWNLRPGSIHNIKEELKVCETIGAEGVIVHLGDTSNISKIFDHINKLDAKTLQKTRLIFETNSAKPSSATYETPEKIHRLFDRVSAARRDCQVGLCIDSAHIYANGVSFARKDDTRMWLNAIYRITTEMPIMFHLNDTKQPLGSGKDQHERIGHGNIWKGIKKENSGYAAIIAFAEANSSIVILERHENNESLSEYEELLYA